MPYDSADRASGDAATGCGAETGICYALGSKIVSLAYGHRPNEHLPSSQNL
jgi:hypothetical protein